MIKLSRLNHSEIVVNCDHILFLESTPDTIITLMNGDKIMVAEGIDEIITKTVEYQRSILQGPTIITKDTTSDE
jgi:flagellar protein FlbD